MPIPDGIMMAFALLYGGVLARLAWLDARYFWLPDRLTLPLLGCGLAVNLSGMGPVGAADALAGAIGGGAALWAVAWGYRQWRGMVGLGGGDPKLFAAIGAWTGWHELPLILLGASLIGLLYIGLRWWRGEEVHGRQRLPLGTLLALAAWPVWVMISWG